MRSTCRLLLPSIPQRRPPRKTGGADAQGSVRLRGPATGCLRPEGAGPQDWTEPRSGLADGAFCAINRPASEVSADVDSRCAEPTDPESDPRRRRPARPRPRGVAPGSAAGGRPDLSALDGGPL